MIVCKYSLIKASFPPKKYPNKVRIITQIPAPRLVYIQNTNRFILARPAGKEIYCLTAGINLPENV